MKITSGEKIALLAAFVTFASLFYLVNGTVQGVVPATGKAMRETAFAGMDDLVVVAGSQGNQDEGYQWRRDDFDPTNEHLVTLPVRYPYVSGQNTSAVIHHGWSPMMKAAPCKAAAWFDNPPQDVMW